ncbi:MAG: ATP-dependent RecD-like DNA helicase [Gammaproteobacteria bacterium]|uniref:ATP-dependent DNA helicase n=1 Tax=Rhodoferax sp. TaxID=50421 RepID=UPI0017D15B37|nr:AAA family ATPase [Rhodoferax sp.]MBU3900893.1 ATP-dependent RecD-like DNA helicase [Gammaproteobacteria bacterium]MBA3057494.1 AAA family ATPase [Rhodoferax sp.]MBU4017558.1 ATP-dependent RecD-like DNA helicase [Gammaproteobacteria bacterium]MBU4078722.1 ATP-dependent RecD-like DNA helicase [Gammaproteobacteria bacterium]MBU4113801.1 ATP-dependent RecD-like DNA helicase [Gammaproteobacteria bacterium]
MVSSRGKECHLIRVLSVITQNPNGAILRGQCITDSGEIVDTHQEIVARLHGRGVAVPVMAGQWWTVKGKVSTNSFINAGGFQMVQDQMEVLPGDAVLKLPSGAHIVDYLKRNPRFKGVGPATADKLWEKFKDRLVGLLDAGDYTALEEVVSPVKALALVQGWQEEGLGKTLQWLGANGVGLVIGRRIAAHFGAEAENKILENPYRLLSFAADWSEVDVLATQTLGVARTDDRRLAAAVEECVYRRFSLGDTYVPLPDLIDGIRRLLKEEKHQQDVIDAAIGHCERTGRLLFDQQGNAYSPGASILEDRVVHCIAVRQGLLSPACNVDGLISEYQTREGNGFLLNTEQRAAVHLVADHHFAVITGGAGCGKTTVLKAVCLVLEAQGYEIVQVALAGKAVKRMQESTGRAAQTIASFIKKLNEGTLVDYSGLAVGRAILIDEASMVDLISFSALVRQLPETVKIVLIGDPHQLPPVGPGLILHCLTNSVVPHVELTVAKRFGTEIADVANSIRDGVFPVLKEHGPVQFTEIADTKMAEVASNEYLSNPMDSVVLCSTRALAKNINQRIQDALSSGRKLVMTWSEEADCWAATGLREGDLVICTRNNWDLGLQNGSMGTIVSVQHHGEDQIGKIEWDDGVARSFNDALLDDLELGYALTVHKSQGSQWKRVVVCLPQGSRMVDRSLIYTAVTRAQSEVSMLGNRSAIQDQVSRKKAADRRHVGLPKRLKAMKMYAIAA